MASVGYATLDIIPSLKGMQGKIEQGLVGPARAAGAKGGDEVGRGMVATIGKKGKGAGRMLAGGLGLGFAAIGVGSIIKSSVQLEASFSKTLGQIAVATGAPKSAMKGLEATALKMGAETSFSANEAAGAMLELGKSGISTRDIMKGGLKGTLTLAAAGSLDLGEAAGIASNAMNVFGLKGRDMGKIAAALAGGANASTASVGSLGQALNQVGPGARNAGLSLQETVGTLAAFDQAGIKGSDAGTSLKTMLTRLTPTTDKAATAMKKYNLDFVDSKGNFDNITTVAQKLKTNLGGLSEAQRTQALSTIFGSDAARAASVLMERGRKGLVPYIKATRDAGAANRMAKANMSGTAGALERLGGAVETAKLKLGQSLAPTVRKLANYLSNTAVPAVTNFMDQLQTGKGFGGQVASGLGQIKGALGDAFDVGKKLVGVFDGLPSGLKKAIAIGGVAAFVAPKIPGAGLLGGAGKGVAKTLAVKIVGKGVQPVFVTNMGVGGLGGGKGTPVAAAGTTGALAKGAAGVAAAGGWAAVGTVMGTAAALVVGAVVAKKLGDAVERSTGKKVTPDSENPARFTEQAYAPGFKKDANGAIDTANRSSAAFKAMNKVVAGSGAAFQIAIGANSKMGRSFTESAIKSTGLRDATARYGKVFAGLPRKVQTAVSAPGADNSVKGITKLGRQYKLTPRQVKTLIALTGAGKVQKEAKKSESAAKKFARLYKADLAAQDKASAKAKSAARVSKQFARAYNSTLNAKDAASAKAVTASRQAKKFARLYKADLTAQDKASAKARQATAQAKKFERLYKATITAIDKASGPASRAAGAMRSVPGSSTRTITVRFNTIRTTVNRVVNGLGGLFGSTGGQATPGGFIRRASGGPSTGGPVWGPGTATSDSIPAMLSNGEYVVRAAAVAKYGIGFMQKVNQLKMAGGGPVHLAGGGQAKKRRERRRERRKEQRERVRDNRKEFDLTEDLNTRGVRKEFDQLRKMFLLGGKAFAGLERKMIRYGKQQDRAEKRFEKAKEKLSGLRQDKASLIDTTTGAYRRDAFGNGASGLLTQLEADRNDAKTGLANAEILKGKGISKELSASLLASGDTNTLAQLATMSATEIDKYDLLYAEQQAATKAIGEFNGAETFNASIKATQDVVAKNRATMERLDKRIEGIERAVERGARRGYDDRVRALAARRKGNR